MQKNFKIFDSAELWQKQTSVPSIPTFSQSLDNAIGNRGIQLGDIIEVIGLPGSGKTQLCMQLCASVQIPKALGGLEAEAIYIDTNTNFTALRFREIVMASLAKCYRILAKPFNVNEEDALRRLHYINGFGLEKFCAFLHQLPKFIADKPKVKLIVIDSITFPFKDGITVRQRTGLLFRQMAELQRIAIEKQIALVLTNEMSTRVGLSDSIQGALGDAWSHRCNKRLLCDVTGHGVAVMVKSNDSGSVVGSFQQHTPHYAPRLLERGLSDEIPSRITHEGIRDVE